MNFTKDFVLSAVTPADNNETDAALSDQSWFTSAAVGVDDTGGECKMDMENTWGEHVMPKTFSVGPLIFGFFSAMGSYLILHEVMADHQSNHGKVIPRLLMGLSLGDMLFSLGHVFSTFASPSELTCLWGNIVNQQTCTTQGFFVILGCIAVPLHHAALLVFHVLNVRHKTDQKLQPCEKWVRAAIWIAALTIAIVPLPLQGCDNRHEACWVAAAHLECSQFEGAGIPCTRAGDAIEACPQHWSSFLCTPALPLPAWPCLACAIWCAEWKIALPNASCRTCQQFLWDQLRQSPIGQLWW